MSGKLRLGVGAALLALLAWRCDWEQLAAAFRTVRWEYWLLAVGLYTLTEVVGCVRWQMLARPLGFHQQLGQLIAIHFVGMFFGLVLPTSVGGDMVRAWYLDGGTGRRGAAFLSVLLDRLSGLLVLLGLACGAVMLGPRPLPGWLIGAVLGTAAAVLTGVVVLPFLARHGPFRAKYQTFGLQLRQNLALLTRPGPLLLSMVVQCANVLLLWMLGRALGVPVADGYYWVLAPVVTLLTLLPVSLNGMGVREGGTVLLLGLQGVGSGTALSLALLWFAVFSVGCLAGAPVYLLGSFSRLRFRAASGESAGWLS